MKPGWLALLLTGTALGQGAPISGSVTTSATNVPPGASAPVLTVPNATVWVCNYPTTGGQPCTNLAPIFSNAALTNPIQQPLQADAYGRYFFWIAPGQYATSFTKPSGQFLATVPFTAASSLLAGTVGSLVGNKIGTSSLTGINVNGVASPSTYGVPAGASADAETTATTTAGSTNVTLTDASSYVARQGIMIARAGTACGIRRGIPCSAAMVASVIATHGVASVSQASAGSGMTPGTYKFVANYGVNDRIARASINVVVSSATAVSSITVTSAGGGLLSAPVWTPTLPGFTGTAPTFSTTLTVGSSSHSYRASTISGLGGGKAASAAVSVNNAESNLALNPVVITFTGQSGAIEEAVYRDGSLLLPGYVSTTNASTYLDSGYAPKMYDRDVPLTPPSADWNDNLETFVQSVSGNTITLLTAPSASVTGLAQHDDLPLVQAAVQAFNPVSVKGDAQYIIRGPLDLTNRAGLVTNLATTCDTGHSTCWDVTGQEKLTINGGSLDQNVFRANQSQSNAGLFCARDSRHETAQELNVSATFIQVYGASNSDPITGGGAFGYYNYGCEISHMVTTSINAQFPRTYTGSNFFNLSSPLDGFQVTNFQSTSAIWLDDTSGGANGPVAFFDNVYSVRLTAGYQLDGGTDPTNYAFEFVGNSGDVHLDGRTEVYPAGLWLHDGATLTWSDIDYSIYRPSTFGLGAVRMGHNASLYQLEKFRMDDYGGHSTAENLFDFDDATGGIAESNIYVGVNQYFDSTSYHVQNNTGFQVNRGTFDTTHGTTNLSHLYLDGANRLPAGSNIDTLMTCGWFDGSGLTSSAVSGIPYPYPSTIPGTGAPYYTQITVDCSADPNYIKQTIHSMVDPNAPEYTRTKIVGAFGAWRPVAPTSNDLGFITPAQGSSCTAGQFGRDSNFDYTCVAPNTWKRVALVAY